MILDNDEISQYLDKLDYATMKLKMESFNRVVNEQTSDKQIHNLLADTLAVSDENNHYSVKDIRLKHQLAAMTPLYRVRKDIKSFKDFEDESQFWNHPDAPVSRFNRKGEHVLYCCLDDLETAIKESCVKPRDSFYVITYFNKKSLIYSPSIWNNKYTEYSINPERKQKINLLVEFQTDWFTRPDDNKGLVYRVNHQLMEIYFKNDEAEAYLYTSSITGKTNNLCIKAPHFKNTLVPFCVGRFRAREDGKYSVTDEALLREKNRRAVRKVDINFVQSCYPIQIKGDGIVFT